jgi:hypothetical protein
MSMRTEIAGSTSNASDFYFGSSGYSLGLEDINFLVGFLGYSRLMLT